MCSWRLEPTDKLPAGKKPCLSLRELEKQIGYDLDSLSDPTRKNIGVTLNTYTHLGLEDAVDELKRVEELENARKEMEKVNGERTVSQIMFRVT